MHTLYRCDILFDVLFLILDTINTQVQEANKDTPYNLVFGQPSRSLTVADPEFQGQLEEGVYRLSTMRVIFLVCPPHH